MYYKKLIGKNIYLAPKTIEDAEKYAEWLNDFRTSGFLRQEWKDFFNDVRKRKENILENSYRFRLVFGIGGAASFSKPYPHGLPSKKEQKVSPLFCRKRHSPMLLTGVVHPSFCHNRIIFESSVVRKLVPLQYVLPLARQLRPCDGDRFFLFNSYDRKRTLNPCRRQPQRWRCL